MSTESVGPALRLAVAGLLAAAAGWSLWRLGAPLPWLIGPMLVFAIGNGLHARLATPRFVRGTGQWLVGTALGLYFTMPVLERIGSLAGWIMLAVVLSLLLSLANACLLQKLGGVDPATAFFASAVGGAAEMANQAERHAARIDQVAAAQAIRVLLVVIVVPFAFRAADIHGSDAYAAVNVAFSGSGLVALLLMALLAGTTLWKAGVPNAWLFGPLALTVAMTAGGMPLSSVPTPLVNLGQLLIGCSLGARFAPELFRDAPRFMAAVVAGAAVLLIGCSVIGALVGYLSGIFLPSAVLATAPGGLAEMGLTAKVLKLGVPVVTAFHTIRLVVVVITAGPLYRMLSRRRSGRP